MGERLRRHISEIVHENKRYTRVMLTCITMSMPWWHVSSEVITQWVCLFVGLNSAVNHPS